MKLIAAAILALSASISGAGAATIINTDGQAYSLQVTEGGEQNEIGIQSGETISVCPAGCFVTMPNGDRETLSGSETVEIVGGKANIK